MHDRFERIGELGRGGSAIVWLAWDRVRGERVALKVLHPHLVDAPGAVARLRRELAAGARIRHPGALLPYELHDEGGQLALSMPLHDGETLAEHVAVHGPWTADAVERLLRRLVEVLQAAHLAGVLHRDVSPHNVMVDRAGGVVLSDFGLARLEGGRTVATVVGTPGFAAPETWRGGRANERADLYGAAAVVVFAATGAAPVDGRLRRPDLSPALVALVERMLAPDPADRPSGARVVLDQLEGKAPEARPALPRARPQLPAGAFRVVAWETSKVRRRRSRLRRALAWSRRDGDHWTRRFLPPGAQRLLGFMNRAGRDAEERLSDGVAHLAGLPRQALAVPDAITTPHFRLVEGVDERTAELAAQLARNEGLQARVLPVHTPSPLGARWLIAGVVSLTWLVLLTTLNPIGAEDTPLVVVSALAHAFWWMASIGVGVYTLGARAQRNLPLVYTADLRPFLRPGVVEVVEEAAPVVQGVDGHVARAQGRIQAARAALHARSSLAGIIVADMERTLAELERTTAVVAGQLASLGDDDILALEGQIAQAEARVRRLTALATRAASEPERAGAGRAVELLDAQAALADLMREHARAEWVEGQRVEAHARLLEVASLAGGLQRELSTPASLSESVDAALARADATRRALGAMRAERVGR